MTSLDNITAADIENGYQLSWSEVADLTHDKQVELFGWCSCEEQEYFPYDDCPRGE